ncbi:MAG: hypothetical protein AAGB13_14150 [Cyanobacteria bacterium P01_F01_bin.33]
MTRELNKPDSSKRKMTVRPTTTVALRSGLTYSTTVDTACAQAANRLAAAETDEELKVISQVFSELTATQQALYALKVREEGTRERRWRRRIDSYVRYGASLLIIILGFILLSSAKTEIGWLLLGLGTGGICGATVKVPKDSKA